MTLPVCSCMYEYILESSDIVTVAVTVMVLLRHSIAYSIGNMARPFQLPFGGDTMMRILGKDMITDIPLEWIMVTNHGVGGLHFPRVLAWGETFQMLQVFPILQTLASFPRVYSHSPSVSHSPLPSAQRIWAWWWKKEPFPIHSQLARFEWAFVSATTQTFQLSFF